MPGNEPTSQSLCGRRAGSTSGCLGESHFRQLGAGGSARVSPGIAAAAIPTGSCSDEAEVSGRADTDGEGDPRAPAEEGYRGGIPVTRSVCEQPLPCSKEGRLIPPGIQFKAFEHLFEESTFQDGRPTSSEGVDPAGGMDEYSRPKGCLPISPYSGRTQEVPETKLGGKDLPIYLPTLWPLYCTTGFHQAAPPYHGSSPSARDQVGNILG